MDKGKMNRVTIGITVMILLAVFLFLGYPLLNPGREEIVLPEESPSSDVSEAGGGAGGGNAVQRVEVMAENVGSVVATLTRPEAYSRVMVLTTFWNGGSGTVTVKSAVSGDLVRTDLTLPGGQVRHMLRTDENTYVWYNSESTYSTVRTGGFSQDEEQWIPTYEDLVALQSAEIAEAGYEAYQQVDCIYAETKEDENGYAERYWVSVDTGLLTAAQRLQNGEEVYRMEGVAVSMGEPEAALFTLPDGTDPV